MSLPPISKFVLLLAIPREFRTEILGDLAEEYDRRRTLSEHRARAWIRRDAVIAALSFPGAGLHARLIIAIAGAAYIFSIAWEIAIASPMTRSLTGASAASLAGSFSWSLFLSVQMSGFVLAAAFSAIALYRARQSLILNAAFAAGPLALAASAAPAIFAILWRNPQMILDRFDWMAAAMIASAIGGFIGAVLVRSPTLWRAPPK